ESWIKDHFSDHNDIYYSDWCIVPNGNAGKNSSNDNLGLAENARMNNDWGLAIQYYYQVLNDSLMTMDDLHALKASTVCHTRLNQVPSYLSWLDDKLISYQTDDEFRRELLNTRALCNRLVGNHQVALDHYSSILDSNPSVTDSSFAWIDMGFAWLESGGNLKSKYSSQMPRSEKDQILMMRKILEALRNPETAQNQVVPPKPILYNNYPNPFNPSTTIEFSIPQTGRVNLSIYNIRGQKVRSLLDGEMVKGQHGVVWNGRDDKNRSVASGVYFIRLNSGGKTSIKKAMLLK
ncbi:MAG: T9SS type A sorting domain-containing protein, partial [Candidatus Cloacimonadaceae bacterium]|nr:T9SS type A sorting domain-containing protein [Candidatus Cloacimonadaceae bacterium]